MKNIFKKNKNFLCNVQINGLINHNNIKKPFIPAQLFEQIIYNTFPLAYYVSVQPKPVVQHNQVQMLVIYVV